MRRPGFKEILLVFLIVLTAYGYFTMESDANANSRLALVRSIVEEHRFEIDTYQAGTLPTSDKALFNNHFYSDKAIGSSLLGIPIYALILGFKTLFHSSQPDGNFIHLLPTFVIGLFSALLSPLIFSFTRRVSNDPWYSLLVTGSICLGTPYFVYSTTYYGHTVAGLFLFLAFFVWFDARARSRIDPRTAILSGLSLGAAIVTEYPTVLIGVIIWLFSLYVMRKIGKLREWKSHFLFLIGGLIPLLLLMYYNYQIFNNPFTISYSHESSQDFYTIQNTGVMGIGLPNLTILFYMTFHTTMGIFWQSPVLVLAFVGWITAIKKRDFLPEGVCSFAVILVYLVVFSGYHTWWGGLAFTPRHLIPALPFFAVPLSVLPRKFQIPALLFAILSMAQMFVVTAASRQGLSSITQFAAAYYGMFQNSTIYSVYFPNFVAQLLSYNRGQQIFGLRGYSSLLPLFILEAVLLIAFLLLMGSSRKSSGEHLQSD
jgi:hypothetical protein